MTKKKQVLKAVGALGWLIIAGGMVALLTGTRGSFLFFITGAIFVSLRYLLVMVKKQTKVKPFVKKALADKMYQRQY